ncbi:MAG TPA: hypothetical protein VGJ18_15925 [Gemmatimonadaceae bacterium]
MARGAVCSLRYSLKPTTPDVMVAYNPRSPRDEERSLSAEVTRQLHSSLTARWVDPAGGEHALNGALAAAADDARTRGLRPEELLLALKAIEEEVATALDVIDTQDRDRFRTWLVGACMRAFFRSEPPAKS